MRTKNTIDDASHQEWVEAGLVMTQQERRRWFEKSAKIEGDACVGAGLPSGIAPCKTQAQSARSLWPDGSLPGSSVTRIIEKWEREARGFDRAAYAERECGNRNDALELELRADLARKFVEDLRAETESANKRQPDENT